MFYMQSIICVDVRQNSFLKNLNLEIRLTQYEMLQLAPEAKKRIMTKSELIRSMIARFPAPAIKHL